jgi:hypothetical integral membrane protein (TIGR02206 family)
MEFRFFSTLHISILAATFTAAILSVYLARRSGNESLKTLIAKIFAAVLILNYIAYLVHRISSGYWELRYDLPMELCNWAVFAVIIALFTGKRIFAEAAYFWVMTGSVNAVLTPALNETFPHPYFFIFFIEHSGVIIACCYAVFGLKLYPEKWAVPRVYGISLIYFFSALLVDHVLNGNYGFLMSKPSGGSLMDYMGDWPYYLITLQVIALVSFSILYIPFYIINRKKPGQSRN